MPPISHPLIRYPLGQDRSDSRGGANARGQNTVSFGPGPASGNYGSMRGFGFGSQPMSIGFNPYSQPSLGIAGYGIPNSGVQYGSWTNPDGSGNPGPGISHSAQQRSDMGFGDNFGGGSSGADTGTGGGGGGNSGNDAGGGEGGAGDAGSPFYQGGMIVMEDMTGPNPSGPDDGYVQADDKEYRIKASSVKKYGSDVMDAINKGNISKAKMVKALLG